MNPLLMIGICVVLFALGSYTTAIIIQLRHGRPNAMMRGFLTAGVSLDVTATTFMIIGSRKIPLTFHGILGYSALLLMATDVMLMWRRYRRHGEEPLPPRLHRFSLAAYSWWVIAFIAGIVITVRMR